MGSESSGLVRVTVEETIEGPAVDEFYQLYEEAFGPLRTKAAARQVLYEHEFREEMADPRIEKYVAWSSDGQPLGLTTLTNNLSSVPWISPEYFYLQYPEYSEHQSLYYLGFTLVRPAARRDTFYSMFRAVGSRLGSSRSMILSDMCGYNVERGYVRGLVHLLRSHGVVDISEVDAQHYYAVQLTPDL